MGFKMKGWSPMKNKKFQGGGDARNLPSSAFMGSESQVNQYGNVVGGTRQERIDRNRELARIEHEKHLQNLQQKSTTKYKSQPKGHGRIVVDDKMAELLQGVIRGGKLDEESHNYISGILSGKKPGVNTNIDFDLNNPRKSWYSSGEGDSWKGGSSPSGLIEKLQLYTNKIQAREQSVADAQKKVTLLEKQPGPSEIPTEKAKLNPRQTPTEYYSKLDREDKGGRKVKQTKKKIKKVSVKDKRDLSKKRAASVGRDKLQDYGAVWEEKKDELKDKFSSKQDFIDKAEEWWRGKGLGSK